MLSYLARSPVFGLLSASLQGLTTIRAFRASDHLEKQFHEKQDMHSGKLLLLLVVNVF